MINANEKDKIITDQSGYRSGTRRIYTVKRVTATKIIATLDTVNTGYEYKFDRRSGIKLPREKYINEYITHINYVPIE